MTIGSCLITHYLGEVVVRVTRIDDDLEITRGNTEAMTIETNVYRILGDYERIAICLYLSLIGNIVVLKFYDNSNLKDYITAYGYSQLLK